LASTTAPTKKEWPVQKKGRESDEEEKTATTAIISMGVNKSNPVAFIEYTITTFSFPMRVRVFFGIGGALQSCFSTTIWIRIKSFIFCVSHNVTLSTIDMLIKVFFLH
jgi:hypothetical protein